MKPESPRQAGLTSPEAMPVSDRRPVDQEYVAALLRKQGEDAARIRDLEQVRDELTQMIVKDMKTPLTGLADLMELADRTAATPLKVETSQFINEALGATETLEELMALLLDVRRMMAGTIQLARSRCDVFQLVGSVAGMLGEAAHAKGIGIDVQGAPAPAVCDQQMITRVVRHLLRNAIQASSRGATVRITVETAGGSVRVAMSAQGGEGGESWGMGVTHGRSAGEAPSPAGLGFTFFRLAVDAHQGRFGSEVEPGMWTTWWFSLPADTSSGPRGAPTLQADESPLVFRSRRYLGGNRPGGGAGRSQASLVFQGTRYQLAVAVTLMSSIPLLAFAYVVNGFLRTNTVNLRVVYLMMPAVIALVGLGILLLVRHSREVLRLRRYLALVAKGDMPTIRTEDASEDFAAMERDLGAVIRQTDEKVKIIESQSRKLLHSEQQRVMVETVGAACHHLAQPATVIGVYLDLMRRKETSPELRAMIEECQSAATDVHNVLRRLQDVARYQTETVGAPKEDGASSADRCILKI